MKRKTVNVYPFEIKSEIISGNIKLTFLDGKHKIILNMERWWIGSIAFHLWELIGKEQKQIDEFKNNMKAG